MSGWAWYPFRFKEFMITVFPCPTPYELDVQLFNVKFFTFWCAGNFPLKPASVRNYHFHRVDRHIQRL